MPNPVPNVPYTRADIQHMVGGEMQTYLPQRDGIILAGCFTIDKMNPSAPAEVQAGNLPKVAAKAILLSQQPNTRFPVFLKQKRSNRYYYFKGYFKFGSISNSHAVIVDAEVRSGRHGELSYVIQLQRA
ncbi:MAG: hypothetical protein ABSE05_17085 [Syntrophales bacterium]|jgi:hypothetical protein